MFGWLRDKIMPPKPGTRDSAGAPVPKPDARVYVAHGDKVWGNSISWSTVGCNDNEAVVHGWLARAPFPEPGDKLLIKMASGNWGVWVFIESSRVQGVNDMFYGHVVGAIDYHDPPLTTSPDEFIENLSPFMR